MGILRTLHDHLRRAVSGFLLGLLFLGLLYLLLLFRRAPEAAFTGLPIIEEINDTYRHGFSALGRWSGQALARFRASEMVNQSQLEILEKGAALLFSRYGQTGDARLPVRTTWRAEDLVSKFRERGFSSGKLKQARRFLSYIEDHKELAWADMWRSGVPASIKMAQALLESDAGRSHLAVNTNNHFGIKARPDRNARRKIAARRYFELDDREFRYSQPAVGVFNYHDDHRYDRFETYRSVNDSYRRHTALLSRPCTMGKVGCYEWIWTTFPVGEPCDITAAARQYEPVSKIAPHAFFDGETTVPYFAACAAGLKMAGYATSPTYHKKLSYIITTYELWRLDLDLLRALADYAPVQ